MAVPTGPASLQDIQDEFNTPVGVHPIALNEYYAGGTYVNNPPPTSIFQTGPIPTSGTISIGNFLGVSDVFIFNQTISVDDINGYSLEAAAIAAGWDGAQQLAATVTINSGVTVTGRWGSGPTPNYAFTTARNSGTYPPGSSFFLINNGFIWGAGGEGGDGGDATAGSTTNGGAGTTGYHGIYFDNSITTYVTNNGHIGAGGGGGGGGGATVNNNGKVVYNAGGGGGGGGLGNGSGTSGDGGALGTATGADFNNPGAVGTASVNNPFASGAGGAGGLVSGEIRGGYGGSGGSPGIEGYDGFYGNLSLANISFSAPGAGGARGVAITNSGVPQWYNYGKILGSWGAWGFWAAGGSDFSGLFTTHTNPVHGTYLNAAYTSTVGLQWYGPSKQSGINNIAAGSYTYYTYYTNPGSSFSAHLYGCVDNYISNMQVNGSNVTVGAMGTNVASNYTGTNSTNSFTLVTGINVIRITVENVGSSASAFNLRIRRTSDSAIMSAASSWWM